MASVFVLLPVSLSIVHGNTGCVGVVELQRTSVMTPACATVSFAVVHLRDVSVSALWFINRPIFAVVALDTLGTVSVPVIVRSIGGHAPVFVRHRAVALGDAGCAALVVFHRYSLTCGVDFGLAAL